MRGDFTYTLHRAANGPFIVLLSHDWGCLSANVEQALANMEAEGFDLNECRVMHRDARGRWDEIAMGPAQARFGGFRAVTDSALCKELDGVGAFLDGARAELGEVRDYGENGNDN